MELFFDSVEFDKIEQAFDLGILTGLTTTPTFMHKHGITDIDEAIVKLSGMVPMLQIEALGDNYEETIAEAHRLLKLPLKSKPVFKIPISLYGAKACRTLVDQGHHVNIHLIYTLNQAYMAMNAGATYICPLVGRLHDQGHDAMALIKDSVQAVNRYGYNSKIMVSSVRHPEHVRQAILLGAHACTIPWGVLHQLTENVFTSIGTEEFEKHTKLMTVRVNEVTSGTNPTIGLDQPIMEAIVKMSDSKLGVVSVVDSTGKLAGVFTDGDIRRKIQNDGKGVLDKKLSDFDFKSPATIDGEALLVEAVDIFKDKKIDNVVVVESGKPIGILDIQDFLKQGLF